MELCELGWVRFPDERPELVAETRFLVTKFKYTRIGLNLASPFFIQWAKGFWGQKNSLAARPKALSSKAEYYFMD